MKAIAGTCREEQSKTEKGPDSESSELPSTDIELYIDEGVKFMIDKALYIS